MTARRPFENRELIATQNLLRTNVASSQYAKIFLDERWNFAGDFTVSMIVGLSSSQTGNRIFFRNNRNDHWLQVFMYDGNTNVLYFQASRDSSVIFTYGSNAQLLTAITRATVTRIGSTIYVYVNTKLIGSTTLSGAWNFFIDPGDHITLGQNTGGGASYIDGVISNLIVLNGKGMIQSEIDDLHHTNILPKSCHPYTIAHYPLNHFHKAKVYDVMEQYNYSRTVAYDVSGFNGTTSPWTFFPNGTSPTIAYGSDGDGAYVQLTIDAAGGSSYFYPIATQADRIVGARYKLTFVIKRTVSNGTLNVQQFGSSDSLNYSITDLPIDTLKTITIYYTAISGGGNYPVIFLSGFSNGATITDSYKVYSVKNEPIREANHGDLINYTNDEIGVTNQLLQSAWHNLYESKKKGQFILKGNGTNMYAQIPGYVDQNPTTWSVCLEFCQAIDAIGNSTVFSAGSTNAKCIVFAGSADSTVFYYNGVNLFSGGTAPSKLVEVRRFSIVYNGTNLNMYFNGVLIGGLATASIGFEFFRFFWQNSSNAIWSSQGILRAVFLNRAVTDRERYSIEHNIPEYKDFLSIQFDLNFGDVFLSGSDYFIRDYSSNARHAQLYNYNPATNSPILIEQSSGLPPITKALRFVRSNAHHIKIANFNPTKEKGYTHIIGFALESDRDFDEGILDFLWIKRNTGNTIGKMMCGNDNTKQIFYLTSEASVAPRTHDYNSDLSKPNFVAFTIAPTAYYKMYTNGVLNPDYSGLGSYGIHGFDEIDENNGGFVIGQDPSATSRQWNGYMFLFGIWKGVLSQAQIQDIQNNTLGQNASIELMTDCQLYLNFNSIATTTMLDRRTTTLSLSDLTLFQTGVNSFASTTGTDGDGDYLELELVSWTNGFLFWEGIVAQTLGYKYNLDLVIKLVGATGQIFLSPAGGVSHTYKYISTDGTGLLSFRLTGTNAAGASFRIGFADGGFTPVAGIKVRIYSLYSYEAPRIVDHSPQNRRAYLNNYSDNEINPAHADYRLIELDTLR